MLSANAIARHMGADSVRSPGNPANYWIYFLTVIFGVPTVIDAWSVTTFLAPDALSRTD
jgi:hypothetical protein